MTKRFTQPAVAVAIHPRGPWPQTAVGAARTSVAVEAIRAITTIEHRAKCVRIEDILHWSTTTHGRRVLRPARPDVLDQIASAAALVGRARRADAARRGRSRGILLSMDDPVDQPRVNLAEDPFDVASGDMEAVARRVEAFFDNAEDDSWYERAQIEIAEGRSIPLDELARRKPDPS